jgi:hypothetical protein
MPLQFTPGILDSTPEVEKVDLRSNRRPFVLRDLPQRLV